MIEQIVENAKFEAQKFLEKLKKGQIEYCQNLHF